MPSPLHTAVFAALDRGALVLTANQRSARTLLGAHGERMRAEGRPLWQPPAIAAWQNWTTAQWQQLIESGAETRLLLSPLQERQLWTAIITPIAERKTIRSPQSLAALAADAFSLLARYGTLHSGLAPLRPQFQAASTDTSTFLQWAQQFDRRCRKDAFLPSARLDAALCEHIVHGNLTLPHREILLVGFDRLSPSQQSLFAALRDTGILINPLAAEAPQNVRILAAADPDAELHTAARAIRQTLTANPKARIAVILPNVAAERARIERIFLAELAPELQLAGVTAPRPFEFSLGITLDRLPMARAALAILRWAVTPLPMEDVSALLLSPYLSGAHSELYTRAEWDAQRLRRATILEPEISLAWLLSQRDLPPQLRKQLIDLHNLSAQQTTPATRRSASTPRLASYSAWMEHAAALLSASGWPDNDRPLDSVEFQLQDRWQELLDHIATLDFTGDQVDFSTALATLETEATQTLFAPRSHHAPVQIMEPLESAGSAWDKLFFLGATDMLWPARTSTHPLIPFSVQQQFAMPGAEPAHTLRDAVAITQRIAASAAVATFSYVQRNSEGEQRPSPCLHELPNVVELHSEPTTPAPDATIALEAAPDDAPLPALPDKVVRGGAAILKLQAQCPFRAFAERRLFSSPLDEIEPGLDPGERGNLLHQVMAAFWDKVRTQQALRQMTTEAQLEALKLAVNVALAKPTATATTPWQLRYLDVQREWLHDLLPDWLEVEMTERPPFQVLHTEFNLEDRSIGPLRLDARVDRIDAMLDDAHPIASDASPQVILDYKTGNIPSKPWDGDRPDEPQLPLYAVLAGDIPVHGIAFARLKAGKIALDECSGPEFNSRLEDWRRVLTNLAEVFVRGNTAVDPKTTDSCRNCAQAALCRIHEHPLTGDSLDD